MRIRNLTFLVTALGLSLVLTGFATPAQAADHVRWDLVNVLGGGTAAGGTASAKAEDGSQVNLTGSGTFVAPASGGTSSSATGGGTWVAFDKDGNQIGSGTYSVTGLVQWTQAPGSLPAGFPDFIGEAAERSAGLAILRLVFSDGERGSIVVSCRLVGTPDTVFEGIVVTKGFVGYWNRQAPTPGVEGNRTLFHVRAN